MGKLVALLAVGSGTVTASVGGFYLLNRSGTGEGNRENSGQIQSDGVVQERKDVGSDSTATNALEDLKFKTLQEFKTNHGGDCAKRYFQDLDYGSVENSIGASNVISASDLQPSVAEDGHPKSCLVINWERSDSKDNSNSSNNKWTGGFRWLWSFVNGDKGFVMFVATKLSGTAGGFDLEGGIYFLAKEGEGSPKTWRIKKHKEEVGNSKKIDKTNFDSSFPKPNGNLDKLGDSYKTNWGFISEVGELDRLCGHGESVCPAGTQTKKPDFKGVWEWQVKSNGGADGTPDNWSTSFKVHLNHLFGEEGLEMVNVFDTFKGSWIRITSQTT